MAASNATVPAIVAELDASSFERVSVGFFGACIAVATAMWFSRYVMAKDAGTEHMQYISGLVHDGAKAFLNTEYKFLAGFVLATAVVLAYGLPSTQHERAGIYTSLCFLAGAGLSAMTGYLGMSIATKANVRTTKACTISLNAGLDVAFKSGAVMGLNVVGFGLLGLSILYVFFEKYRGVDVNSGREIDLAWVFLPGFGFGASAIALFARVGGGIFTKAADVGSDLVGKVESDIPEDDPKNPGVIADNVGDNVGDVAGMGADLFESYVGSIIAAATLANSDDMGGALTKGGLPVTFRSALVALPFWIAGVGIVSSILGIFLVRTKDAPSTHGMDEELKKERDVKLLESLLWSIRYGILAAGVFVTIGSAFVCNYLFGESGTTFSTRIFFALVVGLVSGILIGFFTEYCTSYSYRPTKSIAEQSETGPATVIIQGFGVGMISTIVPTIIVAGAIVAAYELGGVYGVSMSAVSMLSTLGITLATDAYGPVADNAGGIAEMCEGKGVTHEVRDRTDALDALGNTTAATGKGFAIGSAALTAIGLISAFMNATGVSVVDLNDPVVLSGLLIGSMLPYLFSALTMLSVGKSAQQIILDIRAQFYAHPEILSEGAAPDYNRCIRISTEAAIQEMIMPGVIAVFAPAIVGFALGSAALAGMLAGALSSGFMLAVTMSTAGGAWDNAKKFVEKELLGPGKGKKSSFHKAVVVGDTVGDPFKDTSGPALNILIKLMSVISLVLAPLFRERAKVPFAREGVTLAIGVSVVVGAICIAVVHYIDKRNKAFKDEVERQRAEIGTRSLAEIAAERAAKRGGSAASASAESFEVKSDE